MNRTVAMPVLIAAVLALALTACLDPDRIPPPAPVPTPNFDYIQRQRLTPSPEPTPKPPIQRPPSPTPEPLPERVGPEELPLPSATPLTGLIPIGYLAQLIDPPCNVTLQSIIDATATNGVAVVPACTYREEVTVPRAMTISGQRSSLLARPVIKGSNVVTAWSGSGPWTKTGQTVFTDTADQCRAAGENRCNKSEQVFCGGVPMKQRPDGTSSPGAMAFSKSGTTYTIGTNPASCGAEGVEISARQHWITPMANDITIQGLSMMHAGTRAQDGAIRTRSGSLAAGWTQRHNITIQNNIMAHAHGAVVSLSGTDNSTTPALHSVLRNNDISWGGDLCIHGTNQAGGLVQNNLIHDCSTEEPAPGYEAGAYKFTVSGGTATDPLIVDGNVVYRANGPGIWCDIRCGYMARSGATLLEIKRNRIYDNVENGVFFEISGGASIHDNLVYNNGHGHSDWGYGAGILISSSTDAEAYNNTVAWNADGISILSQDRASSGGNPANQPAGSFVHNNFIAQTELGSDFYTRHAFGIMQDWGSAAFGTNLIPSGCSAAGQNMNTCGFGNTYWYTGGAGSQNALERFQCNFGYTTIAAMNASNCEDGGTYASDATKNSTLTAKGIPTSQPSQWTPAFYP